MNITGQKHINAPLKKKIVKLRQSGWIFKDIAKEMGLAEGTVKTHYYLSQGQETAIRIPESPYPRYNEPPVCEGDALILPDSEIPFHHAEFMNRCIDLADAWKIRQMISAGDLLHFESLSGWQPNWVKVPNGGLSAKSEEVLMDAILRLPQKYQDELLETIVEIGPADESGGFSGEMHHARKVLEALDDCFDSFTWVLGNHEGRLLRAIESPVEPSELLNLMKLDEGKWKIAPYYFCYLDSSNERYRIEHPKSAAKYAAEKLAAKYGCHVLMGHSHALRKDFDISGRYHAVQIGHTVDEERLAYAAQRTQTRDAHKLGAAIVRDGFLWVLDEHIDWNRMKSL